MDVAERLPNFMAGHAPGAGIPFASSYYDDPYRALFKLQQRSTVNEYLSEFERLTNRVVGLAPPLLLSCFVSGLSPDLRREVQALQPLCLP